MTSPEVRERLDGGLDTIVAPNPAFFRSRALQPATHECYPRAGYTCSRAGLTRTNRASSQAFSLKPESGLEPLTPCLQDRRSTS